MSKLILFICTGNTCRSPMAEAIFNKLAQDTDYYAASAGIYSAGGQAASQEAIEAVAQLGCDLSEHRSCPLRYEQLLEAEKIVCLTDDHQAFLLSAYPELNEKTLSFSELTGKSVEDPFGGNAELYQRSADAIAEGVKRLLQSLQGLS